MRRFPVWSGRASPGAFPIRRGAYPYLEAVTADFVYIRLHGSRSLYLSDYSEDELVRVG